MAEVAGAAIAVRAVHVSDSDASSSPLIDRGSRLALLSLALVAAAIIPARAADPCQAEPVYGAALEGLDLLCTIVPTSDGAKLFVVSAPARDPGPEHLPVLVLVGGPAREAIWDVRGLLATPALARLRKRHELVFVNARGVSPTRPRMGCSSLDMWRVPELFHLDHVQLCTTMALMLRWHPELLGPDVAAQDAETVRETLGIQRWHVLAASWDSRVAVRLAWMEPDRVASLVLHAPAPVSGPIVDARYAAQRRLVLERIVADCAASWWCALNFPDLGPSFDAALARLQAEPRRVEVRPQDGRTLAFDLTADVFVAAILAQTSTPSLRYVPSIMRELSAAVLQNTELPASAGNVFGIEAPLLKGVGAFAYATQICAAQRGAEPMDALADRFGPRAGLWDFERLFVACPVLPTLAADWDPPGLPPGLPTLILLGRYDAIISEAAARDLQATSPDARLVVLHNTGHRVGAESCAARLTDAFLSDPSRPLDTACADEAITFATPWLVPPQARPRGHP